MTQQEASEIVKALARLQEMKERDSSARALLGIGADADITGAIASMQLDLADARKQVGDADAERITLESMLVDSMGCLQFYSDVKNHQAIGMVASDGGARARVTLTRLFARADAFHRVQALREPPVKAPPPEDGTHGCDTCETKP